MPDQSGRTAVITGGNSGVGFETARVLAARGARLVLGCRDRGKAHDAVTRIRAVAPGADVLVVPLDLASLESVRAAAGQIRSACERIDLVVMVVIAVSLLPAAIAYLRSRAQKAKTGK